MTTSKLIIQLLWIGLEASQPGGPLSASPAEAAPCDQLAKAMVIVKGQMKSDQLCVDGFIYEIKKCTCICVRERECLCV